MADNLFCVCCQVQLHSFKKGEDWVGWKLLGREREKDIAPALGATERILGRAFVLQKKGGGEVSGRRKFRGYTEKLQRREKNGLTT